MNSAKVVSVILAAVLASMAAAQSDPSGVRYWGPIAYWPFDEGEGATAYDAVGTNDGTLKGDTLWVPGQIGSYALSFDGQGDYVMVPDNPSQQITTNQLTVSAWIKLGSADNLDIQRRIISKQQTVPQAWGLEFAEEGYRGSTGRQIVFHDTDGTSASFVCMSSTDMQPEQWYHVAATDNKGMITIYINGQPDGFCDQGHGIPSQISAPIMMGRTNPQAAFFFKGSMDEIALWNRALSAQEVQAVYQNSVVGAGFRPDLVMVVNGIQDTIAEKSDMIKQLRSTLAMEQALYNKLMSMTRGNFMSAAQQIRSAMQQQVQAGLAIQRSITDLERALAQLGIVLPDQPIDQTGTTGNN